MAKGNKTGGRKKGVPNKASLKRQAEIAASGVTPLEFMLNQMRDPIPEDAEPAVRVAMCNLRFEAAKAAAPYVHPRLTAIEHTGKDGGPIETKEVSKMDLARRIALVLRQATEDEHGSGPA